MPIHTNAVKTRLFFNSAATSIITLEDKESLGVRKSLRLREDDWVACFNGDGQEYIYRITHSSSTAMKLELMEYFPNPLDDIPETLIYIASTKGKTKDRMVKDLTPLGATAIVFYQAERSVAKPDPQQSERLLKIAKEACRQCGRSTLPNIHISTKMLNELLMEQHLQGLLIVFYESFDEGRKWTLEHLGQSYHLFYGPEGGFTNEEIDVLRRNHAKVLSLGKRILRSELAAVVGTTIVQEKRGVLS